ncbi:MAG: putative ABC transporter permease [Christensenellaceae bacterium]
MLAIGVLDSRHQILPFLAAYGFGIFVLFFVFGTPTEMRIFKKRILPENTKRNHALRVVVYYALVFVLILFGEMSVGLLFDKCFGVQAWDYRNIPLHITRYTSIPTTFGFTTGITLLMHFVFRPVVAFFERLPRKLCFWLALIFGVLIAADYCIMIGGMLVTGHFPDYWSIRFGK